MVENNYNYIDAMQSSAYRQYSSDQLDNAIQMTGRNCYIFLMDKKETDRTVYGEDKTGRVYLPHFVQRGLYQTNKFTGNLSTINFTETEENLLIQFNFERMVKIINDLKNASSGKLIITSKAVVPLNLIITNEKLILRKYNCTVFEKDLNMKIYYEDNNEKDFLYAYILWFSVNPKKKGIGSYIIKKITAILKLLTNIEVIIIHPKDKEVKNFWIRNRFHEDNTNLLSRRNIKLNTRRILIYELAKTNVDS